MRIQGAIKPWVFKGFDVKTAVEKYHRYYNRLAKGGDLNVGYDSLVTAGDLYLHAFSEEAAAMCKEMKDVISSDREAAAFALACEDMGMTVSVYFDSESEVA